jgi:hypothetical protein
MPMMHCSKHDLQFAGHFCSHLREAVACGSPSTVYVRKGPLAWRIVCPQCLGPEAVEAAERLVCEECVSEWVAVTHNESYRRWREVKRDEPVEGGPFHPDP